MKRKFILTILFLSILIPYRTTFADESITPMATSGLRSIFILSSDGVVYSSGMNTKGQMGDGTRNNKDVATPISAFKNQKVVKISAGITHTLALTNDGKVYAWGDNLYGQSALSNSSQSYVPVEINALRDLKVTSLAGGFAHSLALTSSGKVYSWGSNATGQLGDGTRYTRYSPEEVKSLADVVSIAAGGGHSLALTKSGKVYAWGDIFQAKMSVEDLITSPKEISFFSDKNVTSIGAGLNYSYALTKEGKVYVWGKGIYEQATTGSENKNPIEILIPEQGYAKSISAGAYGILVWADNNNYYTYSISREDKLFQATKVEALSGHRFTGIYSGWDSIIFLENNKLYCFGSSGLVEIGNMSDVYFKTSGHSITKEFLIKRTIRIIINGKQLYCDTEPQITNDRCIVPMRAIFEALGANIAWDESTQTVTAAKGENNIKSTVNSSAAYVNGVQKVLDVPTSIIGDRTFVPLRFIAESLGASVEWDEASQTVTIISE